MCLHARQLLQLKSSLRLPDSSEQCYEMKGPMINAGETALKLGAHLTSLLAVHSRFGQCASSKLR